MLKGEMKIISSFLSVILLIGFVVSTLTACGSKNKDPQVEVIQGEQGEQGEPGKDGADGETPFIGENGNWWIDDFDTGVSAYANDGRDGKNGTNGRDGKDGAPGKDGITPIFSFDHATNFLSVSYDSGASWSLVIDLTGMFESGLDGKDGENGKDGKDGKDGVDGKDGINGKDGVNGITPILSINEITNYWMVSYDNGNTWSSLNILATGEKGDPGKDGENGKDGKNGIDGTNGKNGIDGVDGKDGVTPEIRINPVTFNWEVSKDNGNTWENLGISAIGKNGATGADGRDGIDGEDGAPGETPELYVENNKLYVKYPSQERTMVYDFSTATDAKNGVTPMIRINTDTYMWEVSYDEGESWQDLGVLAVGHNGQDGTNGKDGADGEDGKTPQFYVENDILYVYYDKIDEKVAVYDFSSILDGSDDENNVADGKDGITPLLKIDNNGYWCVSYDNGITWENMGVKAIGADGKNGIDGAPGKDGRGIEKVWISNGSLIVSYTDGTTEIVGDVNTDDNDSNSGDGSNAIVVENNVYVDALDFYPLNNGEEYGVSVGRAIYMTRIEIPALYNGKPVTTILNRAFATATDLEEIIIPETVKTICAGAFEGCTKLSVSLPKSLGNIEENAFEAVSKVEMYASVENIEFNSFSNVALVVIKGTDKLPDNWPEFDIGTEVIYQKENS